MLTELCQELRNWFDRDQKKWFGDFSISENQITLNGEPLELKNGQYFRIVGSLFNDGVHLYSSDLSLDDEDFSGAVWSMAVPKAVIDLAAEIDSWVAKYGGVNSVNMSPYSSESFGGYSYSKSGGGSGDGSSGAGTWQSAFANRLSLWRKIWAL